MDVPSPGWPHVSKLASLCGVAEAEAQVLQLCCQEHQQTLLQHLHDADEPRQPAWIGETSANSVITIAEKPASKILKADPPIVGVAADLGAAR